jgi:hypothetical protein
MSSTTNTRKKTNSNPNTNPIIPMEPLISEFYKKQASPRPSNSKNVLMKALREALKSARLNKSQVSKRVIKNSKQTIRLCEDILWDLQDAERLPACHTEEAEAAENGEGLLARVARCAFTCV